MLARVEENSKPYIQNSKLQTLHVLPIGMQVAHLKPNILNTPSPKAYIQRPTFQVFIAGIQGHFRLAPLWESLPSS